ncbi:hypothetical protein GCM10022419_131610 [Nonomuraea rosea]|uniref:Uncharacterized protein n=1 Tax=Nonomuraea rosea TaxID=638574 RepID=A0ABP7A2I3_9ACTN
MTSIGKWARGDGETGFIYDPSDELLVWDSETRTAAPAKWGPEGTTP